jgi:hypothetical protein
MSLTPTLVTTLATAIGVGSVSIGGLGPTILTDKALPGAASISISGLNPTVVSSQGPTAYTETGYASLDGLLPELKRMLVIYPTLNDAVGEENDLTPTLVENVIEPTTPITHAIFTISGIAPSVIGNGQQGIAPVSGVVTINGLAPEVVLLDAEIIDRFPGKASLEMIPLEPSLLLERTQSPDQGALSFQGLVPTLALKYGWLTVSLSGSAVWTDVPRV